MAHKVYRHKKKNLQNNLALWPKVVYNLGDKISMKQSSMKALFEITTESREPHRVFLAKVDGRPTVFVLWSNHSMTIAPGPELGPSNRCKTSSEVFAAWRVRKSGDSTESRGKIDL
jgi:hypothetical protein